MKAAILAQVGQFYFGEWVSITLALTEITEARKSLVFPPEPGVGAGLAARYVSPELGQIVVRQGTDVVLDFGRWATRVASRKNDDGSISLITLDPTYDALEFIIAEHAGKRALIVRDGQHEYIYEEAPPP